MNSVFDRVRGPLRGIACSALILASPIALSQTTPTLSVLMYFNGVSPTGNVTLGTDNALYGPTSASAFGTARGGLLYRLTPDAGSVLTIHQYGLEANGGTYLGANPRGELLLASDGFFYGVTQSTTPFGGSGTIFRMEQNGSYTKLYEFPNLTRDSRGFLINTTGAAPQAALIEGDQGGIQYLYGTAFQGGPDGTGTIFRIRRDGAGHEAEVLHSFGEIESHPMLENNVPVLDAQGNQIPIADFNPDGRLVNPDGVNPDRRLLLGDNGRLYGVTTNGGPNGTGVVFSVTTDAAAPGFRFAAFDSSPPTIAAPPANPENPDPADPNIHYGKRKLNLRGAYPLTTLVQASDGFIYGTTSSHGGHDGGTSPLYSSNAGYGTIFHFEPDVYPYVIEKRLDFTGGEDDSLAPGSIAAGNLITMDNGNLIVGTVAGGGILTDPDDETVADTSGAGAIFEFNITMDPTAIDPADPATNPYRTLFVFGADGYGQGVSPASGVIAVPEGTGHAFYGLANAGGAWNQGTVFKFGAPTGNAAQGTPVPYDDGGGSIGKWFVIGLLMLAMGRLIVLRQRRMRLQRAPMR
jgi:uncharacterized repeat protein (TIGR03803 family)